MEQSKRLPFRKDFTQIGGNPRWRVLDADGIMVTEFTCVLYRTPEEAERLAEIVVNGSFAPELVLLLVKMVFLHGPRNPEEAEVERQAKALLKKIEGV